MDFQRARNQAILKAMLARLTGKSIELLSYEEVRQKLQARESSQRGLQDVPLDAFVGSVGRYTEFTRDFLPLQKFSSGRWARIKVAVTGLAGLPPIEAYKIGEVYFVKDGNHRLSVAHQLGATHIQAYVTELRTRVPLGADVQPDDLIVKAEYAAFLELTRLDELRPDADLSVTVPGQYQVLEEHISVHRYFMGIDQGCPIPYQESVTDWYDEVYLPVARLSRAGGILHYFPNRTETDLYLWIAEHRSALESQLGWEIRPEYVIQDLVDRFGENGENLIARLGDKLLEILPGSGQENGSQASPLRQATIAAYPEDRMFLDILVPVNGRADGWLALEQAFIVARGEGARLHGLYVVEEHQPVASPEARSFQAEFNRRCAQAGFSGDLVVVAGQVNERICERASWTDLVVTDLALPASQLPASRRYAGILDLSKRCPRPLLAVPGKVSPWQHALLAYDGSPKAEQALFVATYLAGHRHIPLAVALLSDGEGRPQEALPRVMSYLEEHAVAAHILTARGPLAESILLTVNEVEADLLIMGGDSFAPVLSLLRRNGDEALMHGLDLPMLICG
jgi:nucleotide-binding universal stress UspA family protein